MLDLERRGRPIGLAERTERMKRGEPKLGRWLVAALTAAAFGPSGCSTGDRPLVVVTDWGSGRQAEAERLWSAQGGPAGPVTWIEIRPEHFEGWLAAGGPADLILGGPSWIHQELDGAGRLAAGAPGEGAPWVVVGRRECRLVGGESANGTRGELGDDPRVDPSARRSMTGWLGGPDWAARYGQLVAAVGAAEIGEAGAAESGEVARGSWVLVEGGAVPRGSRDRDRAAALLAVLADGEREVATDAPVLVGELTAELLGATLVDAREDLKEAAQSIADAGRPRLAVERLAEPPPWPPASILQLRDDPSRAEDLDALADELTTGLACRAWLRTSFDRPRTVIDGSILAELAAVDDGRLARSPHFRAWLRAEWAAWAGQWYRWVGRRAADRGGAQP